jgi:hypothetical protein
MVRILALIAAVIIAISLLWIGGEMHYRGCVEAVKASTIPPYKDSLSDQTVTPNPGPAVARCSRLPF